MFPVRFKRLTQSVALGVMFMFPAFTPVSADDILEGFSLERPQDNVSQNVAHALIAKKAAVVIDVRTPEEYAAGHIAGAYNIPLEGLALNPDIALLRKAEIPVLVYCRSGRRSGNAVETMRVLGIPRAMNFGGILTWEYGLTTDMPKIPFEKAVADIAANPYSPQ